MGKSRNPNPYNVKSQYYHALFAFIKKSQVVTRKACIEFAMNELKMGEGAAKAAVGVVLSPRSSDQCRGDCRGNASAAGHLYFMEKLNKKKGEDQKLRLRWRPEALEPLKRSVKGSVSGEKTESEASTEEATQEATQEA